MNYKMYEIKGKHVETKRTRTLKISALDEEDAKEKALESGLELCTYINVIPFPEPSQSQLDYAKKLGIRIPVGVTGEDVSALISKSVDNDDNHEDGLFQFATSHKVYVSKYIGQTALYGAIFHSLPTVDRIAFFLFAIYRDITEDRHSNLDTHPAKQKFYQFAQSKENDNKFIKSLERYNGGSQVRTFGEKTIKHGLEETTSFGGSVETIAYKAARQFLIEQNLISEATPYKKRTLQTGNPIFIDETNPPSVPPDPPPLTKRKGCGSVAAIFILASVAFSSFHFI